MKKLLVILLIGASAYGEESVLNTFTSGELSPHMDARVDFEKYRSGCRTLENFYVLPYGGALKRSGTQYIADTKNDGIARLAPFSVGVDQTYIMELGAGYIRFYSDGVQLVDTSSVPIEVVTPYGADDVFEVQMAQFADTVYMVHPDHPIQKLQRTTTAPTFTIADMSFTWPATIEENLTTTTITPSAVTGSVTLTSSAALFTTNHVGSDWVLRSPNDNNEIVITSAGTSSAINVEGEWNLIVKDIHAAEYLTIEVSEDGGNTWGEYRKYGNLALTDYDRSGLESEQGIKYRLVMIGTGYARLVVEEPYLNGFISITNFVSSTQVQAVVQSDLGSTDATEIWYEGAFGDERGYPRTVEFFQNRLWLGGTPYQVNTLWASATDDYENFKTGSYSDSALQLAINSDNIIEWMLARNQMFIGTLGDEWILDGGDAATPISPTTVFARKQTGFGSKDGIDALIASDSIVYLQRQGRKLREFEYSLEADAYKSVDITLLSEHITKGGIVQIAEQQQPEPIIWCVRGDGQLIGMTYNKLQNVYGWHRHTTGGTFESVAVIPTDGEDRVYVVVNRDNGRYIEWFRPVDWGDDDEDAWFVDSGLDYDGGSSFVFTNVDYNADFTTTITVSNNLSDGDVLLFSEIDINTINGHTFSVTNTTSTNFVVQYNSNPQILTVSGAGESGVNGEYSFTDDKWVFGNYYIELSAYPFSNRWSLVEDAFLPATGRELYYSDSPSDAIPPKSNWVVSAGAVSAPSISYRDLLSTGTATRVQNTFTNVSHLAGQTVSIYADGGAQPQATVSTNGVLTTTDYHNRVIAGLPYTARLSPMYIDIVNSQGSSYGKTKSPFKVHFRVNKSGVFQYGSSTNDLYDVVVRKDTLPVGQPVPFFSGDPTVKMLDSPPSTSPEFWVVSDKPLPLELLSLTIYTKVTEYK